MVGNGWSMECESTRDGGSSRETDENGTRMDHLHDMVC